MQTGVNYRTLIEYFLIMQNEHESDRLVYYDQQGTRYEKPIERGTVDEALKKFDGTPRAIVRSSGGLALATPYQLLVYDQDKTTPEIKVKVKFKEFRRDSDGRILPGNYTFGTKVVSAAELLEPFSHRLDGEQRFVVDFGQGPVPVYVFRYAVEPSGRVVALFIEYETLNELRQKKSGKVEVATYKVDRDLLRFACVANREKRDEMELARRNYNKLKKSGEIAIPVSLQIGVTLEVPADLSLKDIRHWLARQLRAQFQEHRDVLTSVNLDSPTVAKIKTAPAATSVEEELLPFDEREAA